MSSGRAVPLSCTIHYANCWQSSSAGQALCWRTHGAIRKDVQAIDFPRYPTTESCSWHLCPCQNGLRSFGQAHLTSDHASHQVFAFHPCGDEATERPSKSGHDPCLAPDADADEVNPIVLFPRLHTQWLLFSGHYLLEMSQPDIGSLISIA